MQLWFNRASEVSIREQLVTQVILGILSGDLAPGQRLPSTRELARRFKLHPNTASAGYRQLEREGWLESRRGSGVFVRPGVRTGGRTEVRTEKDKAGARPSGDHSLDQLISDFLSSLFASARTLGIPLKSVHARLREKMKQPPPDHFLLIEPDEELRKIVVAEIQRAVDFPVKGVGLEARKSPKALKGAIAAVLQSKAKIAAEASPVGTELIALQTRSVPESLAGWLPAPQNALVAVASRWPGFLKLGRTMLLASGFHPDTLVFRDARKKNWQRGLEEMAAVVCDCVTAASFAAARVSAKDLRKPPRVVVFSLLSEASIREFQGYIQFLS
jgi:DNA-binding transcriptional regulator YhcF (GntR family)